MVRDGALRCSEREWRMAPTRGGPVDGTSFVRGDTTIERSRTIVMMLLADRYAELHETTRVRERTLFPPQRIPSELELQARWFAGDFGKHFDATTGDKIDIVQFGIWNREARPDFRDAAIRINGSEPIRGCIELDVIDRSWETHGHATNPAFEETVLPFSPAGIVMSVARKSADAKLRLTRSPKRGATFVSEITAQRGPRPIAS